MLSLLATLATLTLTSAAAIERQAVDARYLHPTGAPCGQRLNVGVSIDSLTHISDGLPLVLTSGAKYVYDTWILPSGGTGHIKMYTTSGEQKCIDAGSNPANGIKLKVWQCYDGLPQQNWKIHDGVIELVGYNLCFDVTDGNFANGGSIQTWQCYPGNYNQKWSTPTTMQ